MVSKIRIISIVRNECNYGQRLQEYSLLSFLRTNYPNCDIKVIDTRSFLPVRQCKDIIKLNKFIEFEHTYDMFDCLTDDIDYYIIGSDQVFNWYDLNTEEERKYFTLDWIEDTCKIITYSTSFDPNLCMKVKNYSYFFKKLERLKCISLREKTNFNFLMDNGLNTPCVFNVDPVFLLDKSEWIKIQRKPNFNIEKNFKFCYTTYNKVDLKEHNVIYCNCILNDLKYTSEIGPSEFIWLINNCDEFYTNSFHGYCFGKILQKNTKPILNLNDNDFRYYNYKDYNIEKNYIQVDKSLNYFKKYMYI